METGKLTKIRAGYYQHHSGVVIEKRGRERRGRNGFVLAGWAIMRNGREISRWRSLERAAEEAEK